MPAERIVDRIYSHVENSINKREIEGLKKAQNLVNEHKGGFKPEDFKKLASVFEYRPYEFPGIKDELASYQKLVLDLLRKPKPGLYKEIKDEMDSGKEPTPLEVLDDKLDLLGEILDSHEEYPTKYIPELKKRIPVMREGKGARSEYRADREEFEKDLIKYRYWIQTHFKDILKIEQTVKDLRALVGSEQVRENLSGVIKSNPIFGPLLTKIGEGEGKVDKELQNLHAAIIKRRKPGARLPSPILPADPKVLYEGVSKKLGEIEKKFEEGGIKFLPPFGKQTPETLKGMGFNREDTMLTLIAQSLGEKRKLVIPELEIKDEDEEDEKIRKELVNKILTIGGFDSETYDPKKGKKVKGRVTFIEKDDHLLGLFTALVALRGSGLIDENFMKEVMKKNKIPYSEKIPEDKFLQWGLIIPNLVEFNYQRKFEESSKRGK